MRVTVTNILDELDLSGEETLKKDLSLFSCEVNPEIESFIRNKAIDFARKSCP